MANKYTNVTNTVELPVAFNPKTAFPLDARSMFGSYEEAEAAAGTAVEAGSSESVYYYGQTLTVFDGTEAKSYIIQGNRSLKEIGSDIPNEYITETELANKGYLTSIPKHRHTQDEIDNLTLDETTVKLKENLYTYTNIGKITGASNTSPILIAEKDKSLKDIFNAVFGTQQDQDPNIDISNVSLSVGAGTTSYNGKDSNGNSSLEYGATVEDTKVKITFTLNNSATAQYGYRCGNTKITTSNAAFKYAIEKQSNADLKIILPSKQTATASMVTVGSCESVSDNILYCNFDSNSNKVSIEVSLDAGSVKTSTQTRYESIKGEVTLGKAQTAEGTEIDSFLTYLANDPKEDSTVNNKLSGGPKSNTTGTYTIKAGSYYNYYLASADSNLSSDLEAPVTDAKRFSGDSVSIECESASHIWFLLPPETSGSKTIQYEAFKDTWVGAFGGETDTTNGPIDVALKLDSGAIVNYVGYYTSAKAAAGSNLTYKIV